MATKTDVLKCIRRLCLECMGGQLEEIRHCTATQCPVHTYRFGKDPVKSEALSQLAKK